MYKFLQTSVSSDVVAQTTQMAQSGQNNRDLPQLLNTSYAQVIRNYFPSGVGRLESREGLTKIFEVAGSYKTEMAKEYTTDIWLFAYNQTLAAYEVSTGTTTNIKTDFTASGNFEGQRAGDYFFIVNGVDSMYRISRTLGWSSRTASFTVGQKLTGATSGATAVILEYSDAASGTMTLGEIVGTFQVGEIITDDASTPGSATVASVVAWTATEVDTAPIASGIKLLGTRLFLYNLRNSPSAVAYSSVDNGSNPPFSGTYTVGTGASDPGLISSRTIGTIRGIELLGSYYIVWGDNGKFAFAIDQIDSSGTIVKVDNFIMNRVDFGGSRGVIMTPIGLVYANENGIYSLLSVGADNQQFSDQDYFVSELLGNKYFEDINMDDSDIIFDEKRKNILITCAKNSATNNFIIGYNIESKALFEISGYGWNISRFFKSDGEIYGASSNNTIIYRLFDGYTDDGQAIGTLYVQELNLNDFWAKNDILGCYTQGFLSESSEISVHFDIYNTLGRKVVDRANYLWTPQYSVSGEDGWGESAYSEDSWGGYGENDGLIECFDGCRPRVRRAQRIILRLTAGDKVPHKINLVSLQAKNKAAIRRRKMAIQ